MLSILPEGALRNVYQAAIDNVFAATVDGSVADRLPPPVAQPLVTVADVKMIDTEGGGVALDGDQVGVFVLRKNYSIMRIPLRCIVSSNRVATMYWSNIQVLAEVEADWFQEFAAIYEGRNTQPPAARPNTFPGVRPEARFVGRFRYYTETEKAIRVREENQMNSIWLPKSQVKVLESQEDNYIILEVAAWIARQRGLLPAASPGQTPPARRQEEPAITQPRKRTVIEPPQRERRIEL